MVILSTVFAVAPYTYRQAAASLVKIDRNVTCVLRITQPTNVEMQYQQRALTPLKKTYNLKLLFIQ